MQSVQFNKLLDEVIERLVKLKEKKGAEYSTDDDQLHNFKAGAMKLGISPEFYCRCLQTKHSVSIDDMIYNEKQYELDYIFEKFMDEILYSILLLAIILERNENT